jgi:hypothetical protein
MYDLEKIEPKYSTEEISSFKNEEQLLEATVELLKQTIELIYIITGLRYCDQEGNSRQVSREEAVIGGNLVRLIKLNTSFLQNICELKSEIAFIVSRCIAETAINIKYMLIEGGKKVKRNYIKFSLITEKDLWNTIKENTARRNGDTLGIEERMRKSIKRSFETSDFDLDEVSNSSKWKSISSRAEKVAPPDFYDIFYGVSSHMIHGNWQDILFNHIKRKGKELFLNFEWVRPRPQIMDAPITLNLDIVKTFAKKELNEISVKGLLLKKCQILLNYHEELVDRHEKMMAE